MYWNDALGAAIEVAIAIAGFSGLVAAFGRRNKDSWTPDDQLRLRVLLTSSGNAGAFAFLPFVLLDTRLDPELAWRIGSGVQLLWLIGIPVYRQRQATRVGASYLESGYRPVAIIYVPILVLVFVNSVWLGASWPYVLGVIFMLFVAFITFVRFMLDSWQGES